jgi:hypothetical protein
MKLILNEGKLAWSYTLCCKVVVTILPRSRQRKEADFEGIPSRLALPPHVGGCAAQPL